MTASFLFSIVIPTYNRFRELDRCLKSLENQTFKNFEVIVCDDGSTDSTKDIAMHYQKTLSLTYLYEKNSGGPAIPRNIGIKHAKANWICFLDSDDCYTSNRLEVLSKLDLNSFDFLYHNLDVIKDNQKLRVITTRHLHKTKSYEDLISNLNAIPTSSTCINKSFLLKAKGFDTNKKIIGLEDFHLWVRISKLDARFLYLPRSLGYYYMGEDNLTMHDERQINRFKELYGEFLAAESNINTKKRIKAALDYQIGWILVNNKEPKKSFKPLYYALLKGSLPIKARSIKMFLQGLLTLIKSL